jgi:hypothetical protein
MEQADVNHEWENIKSVILESAEETIKTRVKHIRNEWWDEECRAAISRKKHHKTEMFTKKNYSKPRTIHASEKRGSLDL